MPYSLIPVLIVVVLIVSFKYSLKYGATRDRRCIEGALPLLDCIADGKRIVGTSAESIKWRREDGPRQPGPFKVAELCRTAKGQWFEHHFEVRFGYAWNQRAHLLCEDQAKAWLARDAGDVGVYERVFGQLEVA